MKRFMFLALAASLLSAAASAQSKPKFDFDLKFTTDVENPVTPVKDQHRSGTCWAYSTIGFLESEAIRLNRITDTLQYPDFSEFFVVSHSYFDRAVKYVRVDGALGFSAGSSASDVLDVVADYGLVPQDAMTGMNYGTEKPVQSELDKVLKNYVEVIVDNPNKKLTTAWKPALQAILDTYYGACPGEFEVDGRSFTPESYRDCMKIVPEDYVSLTSFTHHPFYTSFVVEVCDNWRWDSSFNVPIDELMAVIDNAINNGYTVSWSTDVSDPGFTRNGYAILVDVDESVKAGSDHDRWVGSEEKSGDEPVSYVEKKPTQESRQTEFDNKTMTDDHGMQIYGIAHDQFGNKFYKVKNSWGEAGKFKGMWNASEAFVKGQTLCIMVHKDALTKDVRKKIK